MEKTRVILPLTVGLATSAMIRSNHALLMPEGTDEISMLIGMGSVLQRVQKELPRIVELHDQALRGECPDPQVLEEFDGTGFYSPERDAGYEGWLAAHPEAHAHVAAVLEERRARANA